MRSHGVVRCSSDSPTSGRGIVFLVGAGPGDPDLITVKGLRCLRAADVVVHDRLIHPDLLDEAPPRARRIYVGKAPGAHAASQERIHNLLIAHALEGKVVVRLQGGDPFVFGRGGEEAEALRRAGIPYEVVPGVSSAIAAPACAGIPVTHRGLASSFTVVTGHGCGARDVDWDALARTEGTLVVLMGVETMPVWTRRLIEAGRSPDTPVAVVSVGTTAAQSVVRASLAEIARRAAAVERPAVVVVGAVAALADDLAWFQPFLQTIPNRKEKRSA